MGFIYPERPGTVGGRSADHWCSARDICVWSSEVWHNPASFENGIVNTGETIESGGGNLEENRRTLTHAFFENLISETVSAFPLPKPEF